MAGDKDRRLQRFLKRMGSGPGIILCALVILGLILLYQYSYSRKVLRSQLERLTRVVLTSSASTITGTLEKAELTLQEHIWDMQDKLGDPDAMFGAASRVIENNPQLSGCCISFIPGYYPSKGTWFEPYARKEGDGTVVDQIGNVSHDYTGNREFRQVLSSGEPLWSDPYEYTDGDGTTRYLTTYSYPLTDGEGNTVAVCGLDVDLYWLDGILNARHFYPSSFSMMISSGGELVEGLMQDRTRKESREHIVSLINDSTVVRKFGPTSRVGMIEFRDPGNGRKALVDYLTLSRDPHWTVVQVSYLDEVLSPLRKMMLRVLCLMLAGLCLMVFIFRRFSRQAKKLQAATLEQARIGSELRVASNIQKEMIPADGQALNERKDLDISGFLLPAKEVGGDLYDYFIRDGKLYFCIGDVSGKGIPAAMVMSMIHSLFSLVTSYEKDPAGIVGAINSEVCRKNDTGMFITLFIGIIDLATWRLDFCNAGHDRPFILDGKARDLEVIANLPVGVFEDFTYKGQSVQIRPGTMLFLFTDGVTEAKNAEKQLFTRKRLSDILSTEAVGKGLSAEGTVRLVETRVEEFVQGAEQSDDITMLAMRFPGGKDSIILENDVMQVPVLNSFVRNFIAGLGPDRKEAGRLVLAIEEVVVNVMNYAWPEGEQGEVEVEALSDGQQLSFVISDSGKEFDPTTIGNVDTSLAAEDRDIGGLGVFLARELMDSIQYERLSGRNRLTLKKNIQNRTKDT